jgi:site-specific DNA-cytosine methylase
MLLGVVKMSIRFIDLFAGVGGNRLAFEPFGECVFSCEWDKKAQEMYELNFGEKPHGDIRYISEKDIPDHDILIGGFPCQSFSIASNENLRFEKNETLFFNIARILEEKRPKAFLLENVKGLLTFDKGRTIKSILNVLTDLGYSVYYQVLNSKGLVPQSRERLYIVGFINDVDFGFPSIPENGQTLNTILSYDVDDKYTLSDEQWNRIQEGRKRVHSRYTLADLNSYCKTLTPDSFRVLIPQDKRNPRRLTPREYARLQGFPEDYMMSVSDNKAYSLFGVSSIVPVVKLIAEKMVQVLEPHESIYTKEKNQENVENNNMVVEKIIKTAEKFGRFYCKILSANDLGSTKISNQAGIYISKKAGPLFFEGERNEGELLSKQIKIYLPHKDTPIESRAVWYESKKEYRITRFWAQTEYNREEQYGNLLILIKCDEDTFICHILDNVDDIGVFTSFFNINPIESSEVFDIENYNLFPSGLNDTQNEILRYSNSFKEFPATLEIANKARELFFRTYKQVRNPDSALLNWIDIEFNIFKSIERHLYSDYLVRPFSDMEVLLQSANTMLNRRKSRAGKSFEHHIHYLLSYYNIPFDHPGLSEDNKKPDFLFPSNQAYADKLFPDEGLTFLGAKTTCKDRWRQILNEAERTPDKFLITLQQGISSAQLSEMKKSRVTLVVPKKYHIAYPEEFRSNLLSVNTFINYLKEKYGV